MRVVVMIARRMRVLVRVLMARVVKRPVRRRGRGRGGRLLVVVLALALLHAHRAGRALSPRASRAGGKEDGAEERSDQTPRSHGFPRFLPDILRLSASSS